MKYFSEYLLENFTESQWSIQFISVWLWGLTSVRVFLLGNQLLWKLCGCAFSKQQSRDRGCAATWEDKRAIYKLSHGFPVLKLAQILCCPMLNHRNSWSARYLSQFFIHWTFLWSSYCCLMAFHAYGRPGQISQEKLPSFIQWKSGFL